MTNSDRCIVCLNDDTHDHNADGICADCVYVNRNVYQDLLALVSPVGETTT